jgi:hypothetical protein
MDRLNRFIKAVEYLKTRAEEPTNESVAKLLRYKSLNYISDIIGGSKEISPFVLERMVEFSINKEWVDTGKGNMLLAKAYPENNNITMTEEPKGEYERALPLGDLKITLKDYFNLLEEKARKAEERERELLDIIKRSLKNIETNSKEIADDIEALTTEIQAEHGAMMDSIDVAAKQPIGTTAAAAGTVEIASEQEHLSKGKKTGTGKKADLGKQR